MKFRRKTRNAGFTLIEMMIVLLIMSVIMAAIFKQIDVAQKRSTAEQQKLDMFQESREFVDMMTRDLRNAGYPNSRNFTATASTDPTTARGLLYVGPADIWFEGAVDGDGTVYIVKYHLDTTGTNCPCLRRSKVDKTTFNANGNASDNFSVEVQYVQNGTMTLPIFSYFDANNQAIDMSGYVSNIIDGTASGADVTTLASIQTVKVELTTLGKFADLQTGLRPVITLDSFVTMPNCSQMSTTGMVRC
jgi:prepilin-type N-terminal cleavage/methylation domain-containing protein